MLLLWHLLHWTVDTCRRVEMMDRVMFCWHLGNPRERPFAPLQSGITALYFLQLCVFDNLDGVVENCNWQILFRTSLYDKGRQAHPMILCNSPDSSIFISAWLNKSLTEKIRKQDGPCFLVLYISSKSLLSTFFQMEMIAHQKSKRLWNFLQMCESGHLKGDPLGKAKALSR